MNLRAWLRGMIKQVVRRKSRTKLSARPLTKLTLTAPEWLENRNMQATFAGFGATTAYYAGEAPIQLAQSGTVAASTGEIARSQLLVEIANADASDRLILSPETGVQFDGDRVEYYGADVGKITQGNSRLDFEFNDVISSAAVQAIVRAVRYFNTSSAPNATQRLIDIELTTSSNMVESATNIVQLESASTLVDRQIEYPVAAGPRLVAESATVSALSDNRRYSQLVVGIGLSGGADRLTVLQLHGITINDSIVSHRGTVIGSITQGVGSSPLVVDFDESASLEAVNSVVQSIAYYNLSAAPHGKSRIIRLELHDDQENASDLTTTFVKIAPTAIQTTPLTYGVGEAPATLTGQHSVALANQVFQNAQLVVVLGNFGGADRLSIQSQGRLAKSGGRLFYDGTEIGSFRIDLVLKAIVVQFNSEVTSWSFQAVLDAIGYDNVSPTMRLQDRTIDVQVIPDGGQSTVLTSCVIRIRLPDYSDEFNTDSLNPNRWRSDAADWGKNWSWNDGADNLRVVDGALRITATWAPHLRNGVLIPYDSAIIQTSGPPRTYGYFEARIRATSASWGVSPAFWLYNNSPEHHSEIDVVELTEDKNPRTLWSNMHWFRLPGEAESEHRKVRQSTEATFDPREDFHLYAVDWQQDAIRWYVDGVKVFEQPNLVMHQPMQLAISLGIRAPLIKNPSPENFPRSFDVDYVRSYARNPYQA